ncbi:hypothetical protein [Carnobacterium maltaromaticum]|uniref:Uncharacterized protein n=1 Tax=Carnobacterium maltaromaticum TaxID=2751 RepID=A0AAW9JVZ7_CARML|nr:hypothetical protein [Carnobacterium maltaromaticum]MDZ5760687.1 hypothetical protein [Carnobacterium maltaromaticum]
MFDTNGLRKRGNHIYGMGLLVIQNPDTQLFLTRLDEDTLGWGSESDAYEWDDGKEWVDGKGLFTTYEILSIDMKLTDYARKAIVPND